MNISLNSKFEGGDLQFYSSSLNRSVDISHESNLQMSHKEGYGVMHCGRQYHSALPIIAGIRYNLIIWMRSSTVRNICPMCNQTPDLVQVPIAGDGFIPIPKTRSQCHLL
ncbi:2-oxoglutarate and iron-dependent oxygenase domain-containing protein 2 [Biomphalaria glabrata]